MAKAALRALLSLPESEISQASEQLISTRPTEPLMQNCLALVKLKGKSVVKPLLARLDDIKEEIVKNGLPLIKKGSTILTHCHSSTVVALFKMAKKKGFNFKVYLTETRPVLQGRITAKELTDAHINSTMITDSEAAFLVSRQDKTDVDLVLLGADAITPDGGAVNKVGSYGIALAANEARVPVYIVAKLLKFAAGPVEIEERSGNEVWKNKPSKLKILNPAFDKIPAELITGFVTEFGIIKPEKVKSVVKKNYPWIVETNQDKLLRSTASNFSNNVVISTEVAVGDRTEKSSEARAARQLAGLDSSTSSAGSADSARNDKISPYKSYLHLNEKVDKKNYLLTDYFLRAGEREDFLEVAGGVAAESSVGTWTEVTTQLKDVWKQLHARVLLADKKSGLLKIAYPLELFEPGNLPQLLSCVAGNIFGLKEVENLKLLDLKFPEKYVKSFPGPALGIKGIRKITGINNRPLIGCIIKPKLGLNYREHARVARDVYDGGVDFVKDDENLTSQEFNPFEKRVLEIEKTCFDDLNHHNKKIYAFNVTALTEIMLARSEFVKRNGGNCVMIDFLTAGFAALQTLRKQNLGLIIHGHRAMHAALDRLPNYGVSMLVLAKLARLAGIDSLHTGTVVGKMEGGGKEISPINRFLLDDWYGLKPVLPVASGGLYPGLVPELIKILGREVMLNFGGGIHGHPQGSKAGAKAVLAAVEAAQKGISLLEYAKNNKELAMALQHWGRDL